MYPRTTPRMRRARCLKSFGCWNIQSLSSSGVTLGVSTRTTPPNSCTSLIGEWVATKTLHYAPSPRAGLNQEPRSLRLQKPGSKGCTASCAPRPPVVPWNLELSLGSLGGFFLAYTRLKPSLTEHVAQNTHHPWRTARVGYHGQAVSGRLARRSPRGPTQSLETLCPSPRSPCASSPSCPRSIRDLGIARGYGSRSGAVTTIRACAQGSLMYAYPDDWKKSPAGATAPGVMVLLTTVSSVFASSAFTVGVRTARRAHELQLLSNVTHPFKLSSLKFCGGRRHRQHQDMACASKK